MKKINKPTVFDLLFDKPVSASQKFHNLTKLKNIKGIASDTNKWPESWKTVYFKSYPRLPEITLPTRTLSNKISFSKVLNNRKSQRKFSKIPLSLNDLGSILFHSAGLRINKFPWTMNRFYPSGGGRYPLEVYLISINTELPKGIYHYYVKNNSLELLSKLDNFKPHDFFVQKWFYKAPCFIIISSVFKRTTIKYGDRGYRFVMIEAGHLGQNIYLTSVALNLACCAIGGFIDDRLNQLIGIDGIQESVIYALALGYQ